jgi:hypothetical protein
MVRNVGKCLSEGGIFRANAFRKVLWCIKVRVHGESERIERIRRGAPTHYLRHRLDGGKEK